MKSPIIAAVAFSCVVGGCAGTATTRWSGATQEEIQIEGSSYRVVWLRTPEGIDAHSNNASLSFRTPDPLTEKRQAIEAIKTVARRECQRDVQVVAETTVDQSFAAEMRCAVPQRVDRRKS